MLLIGSGPEGATGFKIIVFFHFSARNNFYPFLQPVSSWNTFTAGRDWDVSNLVLLFCQWRTGATLVKDKYGNFCCAMDGV